MIHIMKSMEHIYDEFKKDGHYKHSNPKQYFDRTKILVYMEDAVFQLLQQKDEISKMNPNKFFFNYFTTVNKGSHILFREYSFISATLHNRISFVKHYSKSFMSLNQKGDFSAHEYHSFALLLCPDFPCSIIHKSFKINIVDESVDGLLAFPDFVCSFHLLFCYEDFITECHKAFVLLSNIFEKKFHDKKTIKKKTIGVDSKQFLKKIETLQKDESLDCPSISIIKDILHHIDIISYSQFLSSLVHHKDLLIQTNILPLKSQLSLVDERNSDMSQVEDVWH